MCYFSMFELPIHRLVREPNGKQADNSRTCCISLLSVASLHEEEGLLEIGSMGLTHFWTSGEPHLKSWNFIVKTQDYS
jgi:hypothetical protein